MTADILIAETPRLQLVVPSPERAEEFCAYVERNLDFHRSSMPSPPKGFETSAFWRDRLAERFHHHKAGRLHGFAILCDGQLVGDMSFTQIMGEPQHSTVLGYKLDRSVEGRGYMQEALGAALAWMFDERKRHRIEANVRPNNKRSLALLERLGFIIEGYSHSYLRLDGRWCDHVRLALFNPREVQVIPSSLDLSLALGKSMSQA
ncbi:GNAT family N-acetyltransferase [bacterium]|nr:GNAT family N-acetyltransferase [bacterium]